MKTVHLHRIVTGDQGTFGVYSCPDLSWSCYSLEPPWRSNLRGFSCIPKGEYIVRIRVSPKYGKVYHVQNVKDRSYILIHSGNFAGNIHWGFKTHSQGCILLGLRRGQLHGQKAVLMSRIAVREFMRRMNYETFKLIVQ